MLIHFYIYSKFILIFHFKCWQWQLLAVNLTLAWLNLLGDVRQLPFLGIYVIMFFDILKTFMQFGLVFVIFIVAFGLGFHLLLINQVRIYILITYSKDCQ